MPALIGKKRMPAIDIGKAIGSIVAHSLSRRAPDPNC